jgi:UDP-N-acetylmuramoyl-L-alanyl-D-glutamate--2,6-diaminopimelate ligase
MNQQVMLLSELLVGIVTVPDEIDGPVSAVGLDSRVLSDGGLFLALPGEGDDGVAYIPEAIAKGARWVLCEGSAHGNIGMHGAVPVVQVMGLKAYVSQIAAIFYGEPAANMSVVGVTGTNGKSSCVHFLSQALAHLGHSSGMIGTLGWGLNGALIETTHTTPDPITVQSYLATMRAQGGEHVAMEVSSHALMQGRVAGVPFKVGLLTNITRDHLDYHGSMAAYAEAKARLFSEYRLEYAVFNMDDPMARALMAKMSDKLSCVGYSCGDVRDADVCATALQCDSEGMRAEVVTPWGSGAVSSAVLGRFNASNILAVLSVLGVLGERFEDAVAALGKITGALGRMQVVSEVTPKVVVDYAHTPDALHKALLALREGCRGRLWCVFGCGGDRDSGKRALMGEVASMYSDCLVVTDDNPRTESPAAIVADVLRGVSVHDSCQVIHDRARAIAHAIACAQPDDVVLIAGKGHERYQLVGSAVLPFSDVAHAQEYLALRSKVLKEKSCRKVVAACVD